jgi:hypothetical protein
LTPAQPRRRRYPTSDKFSELTVITNSIKIAIGLLDAGQIHVMLPGGKSAPHLNLAGWDSRNAIFWRDINIESRLFWSAWPCRSGRADRRGIERSPDEASRWFNAAAGLWVLLDARKWGRVAAATFAPPDEISDDHHRH